MTEELITPEASDGVTVVSVKFKNRGKLYFFDPQGMTLPLGETVIVETAKGLEIGDIAQANHTVSAEQVAQPLRPVVRVATEEDRRVAEQCRKKEREAYIICKRKIEEHGLEMKLVDVECAFEGTKILFFFSSDGRVDFRDLVKDLAGIFRTRIELRQIGVRDEARMLGGLGVCGRPFCCSIFMEDFQPVSTKMAKTQSMSLNPAKISGSCGRLMCCLRYEQAAYEDLVKNVPKNGAFVETPDGYGNITQVNILRQTVKVKLDGPGDDSIRSYDVDEVAAIPGGRPRDGSQPPHVLVLKPKKPAGAEESDWSLPNRLISAADISEKALRPEDALRKTPGHRRPKKDIHAGEPRQPKPESAADRAEGASRYRSSKKRRKGAHSPKPQSAAPEKRPAPAPQPADGEAKSRKHRSSRSRNYKPRPKPGGEDGASGGSL